jgi:hypothetical protein
MIFHPLIIIRPHTNLKNLSGDSIMPFEPKPKKTAEEIAFNKRWGKLSKLNPSIINLSSSIGKAPKCSTKVKVEKAVENTPKKKK